MTARKGHFDQSLVCENFSLTPHYDFINKLYFTSEMYSEELKRNFTHYEKATAFVTYLSVRIWEMQQCALIRGGYGFWL